MRQGLGRVGGRVLAAVTAVGGLAAGLPAADHPFILWTAEEAAAIRRRIETEPWARRAYDALCAEKGRGDAAVVGNLLRFSAMGDRAAGEKEKAALLGGGGRGSSAHVEALRYDVLYDLLAPDERRRVEQRFRQAVEQGIRGTQGHARNRWNWLPNLQYVWYLGRHLQAVALRDPGLVRKIFHSDFGMEWYVGTYLSDMGFYNEEFGKSNWYPALALLYAEGCRRLGLDDVGYGFRGRSGQSIRGSLEAYLAIGYPRVDLGTGRHHYATVTMGDAKNQMRRLLAGYGFQQANLDGYRTDGAGGATRAYGSILAIPHWFELAHRRWPEAGFDYFLAEMRPPGDDRYYPSLFFGLDPIDAAAAPPPAPSAVHRERGLVMLRAEEGPEYWRSPAPAVCLRLATPYAHHVEDYFSLLGFYAFNRPIYVNHSHSTNYSGVDPQWSNSIRSHSGVIVDYQEPRAVGEVPARSHFSPLAKFAAARARGIYPGVDQTRALVLAREYLLDVFALASPGPRAFQWVIQTFGHACPDRPTRWAATRDLVGSMPDLGRERSWSGDEAWSVTVVQTTAGADPELSGLGERWFRERVGSRITMLGAPETTAYTAWSPVLPDSSGRWMGRERFMFGAEEPAGVAVVAARRGCRTAFVALHEPLRTVHRIREFRRIHETPDGVAVAVVGVPGSGVNDRVLVALGDAAGGPMTLAGGGEAFTFAGYAFVRAGPERVDVAGDLRAMRLTVGKQRPALYVNGEARSARIEEPGDLVYGSPLAADAGRAAEPAPSLAGPIAARWRPETYVGLPAGGRASATLVLRNGGLAPVTMKVSLAGSEGLRAEPAAIALKDFQPGDETAVEVRLAAAPETANRLLRIEAAAEPGSAAEVQPARLQVAHGLVSERGRFFWPADFTATIYGPRYLARYYYMESGAAALLLDPSGLRRTGPEADTWPELYLAAPDDQGRTQWRREKVARFAYFIPVVVRGESGGPAYLYEGGRHAHGAQSMLEHWFTEDWIVVRYREGKPGDRAILNWFADPRRADFHSGIRPEIAALKAPGKLLLATESGGIVDGGDPAAWPRSTAIPKDAGAPVAVFRRLAGLRWGEAMLFVKGAELTRTGVAQAADAPVGFTYATQDEFPALVEKWRRATPSGQAEPAAQGLYGGAFMPKPEL